MKKKINVHSSKVWEFLYPIYAREFLFGSDYEQFALLIQKDFDLTTDQWMAVLEEWELKERILSDTP